MPIQGGESHVLAKMGMKMRGFRSIRCTIFAITLLSSVQVSLAIISSSGHVHHTLSIATASTLLLNAVTVLMLIFISWAFGNPHLGLTLDNLEKFVDGCGRGLDWRTRAKREYQVARVGQSPLAQ